MYLIKSTDQQLLKYVEWKSCLKSKIISYVSIYNCIHCVYLCKKKWMTALESICLIILYWC